MNTQLKPSSTESLTILAGARKSPLSKVQVEEVSKEIQAYFPDVKIEPLWLDTIGDKDQITSLRNLDKTDFFTKEIDELLLQGKCSIGVHSAKDLPSPIPEGLRIVAVTKGIDCSDSLVFRKEESLESLPIGAKIATSSVRREEAVKELRSDLTFIDLRGTIGKRLSKLDEGSADGVVLAEAALIRLNLTHLNRIRLPGETTPGQGQLAVVARESDQEMVSLFSAIDSRAKVLYLGLHKPEEDIKAKYEHYPIIKTIPRSFESPDIQKAFQNICSATHLIFTSQTSVSIFFEIVEYCGLMIDSLKNKTVFAVGTKTAKAIESYGLDVSVIPTTETAEGIVQEIEKLNVTGAHFFWPHSGLSRPVLREYFTIAHHSFDEVVLYDTVAQYNGPLPPQDTFDEVIFTSPSTIDAYLQLFGCFPEGKTLKAIGPITARYLTAKTMNNGSPNPLISLTK